MELVEYVMAGFEWTIKFGDLLTVASGLIVAAAFLFRKGGDYTKLQMAVTTALEQISELKKDVKDMGDVIIKLAVQEERITMLTKWYDELRRGVGKIGLPPSR